MTATNINMVKNSWVLVASIDREIVGGLFYNKLFEIMPEVKPMFNRSSIPEQSRKLISMLSYVIARLDRIDQVIDEIRNLAKRHTNYGVQDRHYDAVGEALLWTLEQGLGSSWNQSVNTAWKEIYSTLAAAMISASHETVEKRA